MIRHQRSRMVVQNGRPSALRRRMLTQIALPCLVLGTGLWVEVLAPAAPAAAAAPTISSFSPTQGPIGTTVTLHGSGLTGATAVTFNRTASVFAAKSSSRITAIVSQVTGGART